jgi:membrane protein
LLGLVNLPVQSLVILQIIQWISFILVLLLTFGLVYRYLPDQKDSKCSWISTGSITAIILWVICTNGFRFYLHYFNNYDKTYGSLGAVIILELWLYLTALVILIGGSLNSILEDINCKNKAVAELPAIESVSEE